MSAQTPLLREKVCRQNYKNNMRLCFSRKGYVFSLDIVKYRYCVLGLQREDICIYKESVRDN